MNVLLFLIALIISFIIIRIGAIAFELTGLEWSMATFQSLSCFSGTGFTTKESELVTGHHQRRKIASVLMVLGNIGLVTLIATFANSLRPELVVNQIAIPVLDMVFPIRALPWINLLIIIFVVYITYRIAVYTNLDRKFTDFLRSRIMKNEIIKRVSYEELVVATGGYGISQIEICDNSPIIDKTLMTSELRSQDITVLAIERERVIMPNPPARTKLGLGDKLICFGKLENIRRTICLSQD